MRSRVIPVALAFGLAAGAGLAIPASATVPQVQPRAGNYIGTETGPGRGNTLTFTVSKNRKTLRKLIGSAEVRKGCKGRYSGYQAPTGPMAIGKKGRFTASSTHYPGPKLRITVVGKFTSPTAASGRITIRFKRLLGCNTTTPFSVTRVS